jgi:hypothetical protein
MQDRDVVLDHDGLTSHKPCGVIQDTPLPICAPEWISGEVALRLPSDDAEPQSRSHR